MGVQTSLTQGHEVHGSTLCTVTCHFRYQHALASERISATKTVAYSSLKFSMQNCGRNEKGKSGEKFKFYSP